MFKEYQSSETSLSRLIRSSHIDHIRLVPSVAPERPLFQEVVGVGRCRHFCSNRVIFTAGWWSSVSITLGILRRQLAQSLVCRLDKRDDALSVGPEWPI